MLDDRFHRGPYADVTDRADAPLDDAVAMMVRERLTGLPPPAAAQRIVDLWRPHIEERAGGELNRLDSSILDQRAFAKAVHKLLASLDMASDSPADADDEDGESGEDAPPENADDAEGESQEEQSK